MIGRITQLMSTQQILSDINQSQGQLDTTEQELSSGLSINQPSDNPYGASLAVTLNDNLSALNGYANNVTDGTAWTQAADSSMQNIASAIQTAQDLVVQGSNGTMSSSDLSDSAAEISQIIDSVKQTANTQFDGQYVFSGTATATAPYSTATGDVYQGNGGAVTRQIGPGSSLQVNTNISQVLGSGPTASDGGLLDTLSTVVDDMTGTNGGTAGDLSKQLTALGSNLSTLATMQATVGASEDRLTLASTQIASLQNSSTAALSNDEDANMATTMTTYSNQEAAFTAALKAGASIVQTSLMDFLSTN
ncbi:MAG: flagellar hook-associated protein FlgL [Solirubrobacteraceae bacterium]